MQRGPFLMQMKGSHAEYYGITSSLYVVQCRLKESAYI